MSLFYISFSTETDFLGATIVSGLHEDDALIQATKKGLNPGGQAAIILIPQEALGSPDVNIMSDRLMSKEDMIKEIPSVRYADMSEEQQALFEVNAVVICEKCNK